MVDRRIPSFLLAAWIAVTVTLLSSLFLPSHMPTGLGGPAVLVGAASTRATAASRPPPFSKSNKRSKRKSAVVPSSGANIGNWLAKHTVTVGQSGSKSISRIVKRFFSSDFESIILELTNPDDSRPPSRQLLSFLATVKSFSSDHKIKAASSNNPYRITLRKLWLKMSEGDARTVMKSLSLLHLIYRSLPTNSDAVVRAVLKSMSSESCKRSASKYFDAERLCELSEDHRHLHNFISRYAGYCFQQSSMLSPLDRITHGLDKADLCPSLLQVQQAMDSALACAVQPLEESELTSMVLELVANDVQYAFKLLHEKLQWLLNEHEVGDVLSGWTDTQATAVLNHWIGYFNETRKAVESFLNDARDILELYGVSVNTEIPLPLEQLSSCSSLATDCDIALFLNGLLKPSKSTEIEQGGTRRVTSEPSSIKKMRHVAKPKR